MGYILDHHVRPVQALPETIPPGIAGLLPPTTAVALQTLPLRRQGDTLQVAMTEPLDWARLQQLRLVTGCRIQARLIDSLLLEQGLVQWYPDAGTTLPSDTVPKASAVSVASSSHAPSSKPADETDTAAVVQMVDRIIAAAVARKASDIHIEPFEQALGLRYRIDGFLQAQPSLPWPLRAAIVSRIKVLANLDIAEKRRPQDGKIRLRVEGRDIDFRVSTTPTAYGEKVVLRILDRDAVALDLSRLGMSQDVLVKFRQAIARPYGLILVSGPTGSGKTTTLYAALNHIKAEGINILTVEDPIEYNLPGVNQTQVHAEIGLTFAQALRSFLRQDPNVILVGEIRDRETAAIAIQAALTGHLVLSSVHTNDAAGAVSRLLDMGIEPFLVSSSLTLVLAQRLVRRNCPACKKPAVLSAEERAQLGLSPETAFSAWQGAGCSQCYGTGYRGRIAVAEAMGVSAAIAGMITKRVSGQDIGRQAMHEGMRTLREDGLEKIAAGITSVAEVIRETVGAVHA